MDEMLESILKANRAKPDSWIKEWLVPKLKSMGCEIIIDEELNVYVPPTGDDTVLFVAHTDTVDNISHGDRELSIKDGVVYLADGQTNSCLGADDGAGIYILLKLILAGVEGGYLFTTGEESGGIGVDHFIRMNEVELKRYKMSLEFDRYGYDEVITHQAPGQCASESFAESLADIMNAIGDFTLAPSAMGIYTDNADLSEYIPECVNVSVGYYGHHTKNEWLDIGFVEDMIQTVVTMSRNGAFDALPVVREAGDYGEDDPRMPWNSYTNDVPYEVTTVQGFVKEYPAVVTEFLLDIGVDLYELNEFANRAGYDMGMDDYSPYDYGEDVYDAANPY